MELSHNKYIKHIEQSLLKSAPVKTPSQLTKLSGYIGTKNRVLGYSTPVVRQMVKSELSLAGHRELPAIANEVYRKSTIFEAKNVALYLMDNCNNTVSQEVKYDLLPSWIVFTDNWAHSDYLSKFYSSFLESEKFGKDFLQQLKKWNSDANLWKRRQSLVSLYFYARSKKKFLPYRVGERLMGMLLKDQEYFVQKGLGWALRESFHVYPEETFIFISKNAGEISSTAFSAACEKMSIKQKEVLKAKRKKLRKKI